MPAWTAQEAPTPADRDEALAVARRHRDEWLQGDRGELGVVSVDLNENRV